MDKSYNEFFIVNDTLIKSEKFSGDLINSGKSLYEVLRIIDGEPLFLEKHLERLENSSKLTGFNLWLTQKEIEEKIYELIEANKVTVGNIKIVFNFNDTNNVYLYFLKHSYPSEKQYEEGVSTILYHGERENPNAKVINNNFRESVDKEIKDMDAFEAILVNNEGYITEGSKSNIFMIKDNKVITSPIKDVLPGITRDYIINVCLNEGYEVIENRINYEEISDLDGLFISGTSPKVLPIKKVDSIEFKSSQNKVVLDIMQGYNKVIKEYIYKRKSK